ncbi:MAG: hypothetical protein V4580_07905 [Bacteroidota bacterium]
MSIHKLHLKNFEQFYDMHSPCLYTFISSIIGDNYEAEKLLNHILLKTWNKTDARFFKTTALQLDLMKQATALLIKTTPYKKEMKLKIVNYIRQIRSKNLVSDFNFHAEHRAFTTAN